jgi:hypothetical protein
VDGNGNRIFIRDPNRTGVCSQADQTACFPGNIIPPDRFFVDGPAILNLYPLPNFPGQNQFNYTSSIPNTFPRREDILRVDYNISERTRLSARYSYNPSTAAQTYFAGQSGANNFLLSPIERTYNGRNGSISLWHSFSPALTNEFIFGPSSSAGRTWPRDEKATRKANRITFPLLFPDANPLDYLPSFMYGSSPTRFFRFITMPIRFPIETGTTRSISATTSRRSGTRI